MNVFDLDLRIVRDYERFARSFTEIRAEDIREQVDAIYATGGFWPEPLISVNPHYERDASVADLAKDGSLHSHTADVFRVDSKPITLYRHQAQAIAKASAGNGFVVTTGTGSGKSLCFFIPIIDAAIRARVAKQPHRTRAIVVYPMNALANSQMQELGKFIEQSGLPEELKPTFARYTGQESPDERELIKRSKPDILLTNFMMLELLMTRQNERDQTVIANAEDLDFLVLDELHTYRGRQGADVAMLVRRVRDRLCRRKTPICIGTSATMASEGAEEARSVVVSKVATRLFGLKVSPDAVIDESLERATNKHRRVVPHELSRVVAKELPPILTDEQLREHPLSIWIELEVGLKEGQRLTRRPPLTIQEAAAKLADATGQDTARCRAQIEGMLTMMSRPSSERGGSGERAFLAFKLHRFIAGAGFVYATLKGQGDRRVTLDGQRFDPSDPVSRLYPTFFCRTCGQEFHPVVLTDEDGAHLALPRPLWGLSTNGELLRLMRDNASLTRPAYVEVNLREIFEGENFADFAAAWLLLHSTRFGTPGSQVTDCDLERWREAGAKEGLVARDRLRDGVESALLALGNGFLAHRDNAALRDRLANGELALPVFFGQLLRLVYRLIFLLVADDRGLLHAPDADTAAAKLYAEGYSVAALRERALRRTAWDRHYDRWEGLLITFRSLADGQPKLGLPALGGLFENIVPDLEAACLSNKALMEAIYRLAWLKDGVNLVPVNWRDMETEELGSVYESLLELTPILVDHGRGFDFAKGDETKGNQRKTTGSYYTPDSLVQTLLDSALDPVLDRVESEAEDRVEGLLGVTVVDPACGSGHFLLGAARRIATRVARARTGGVASAADYRHALRDLVRSCIHGVDRNPMAVELTKVALWIETVEPGKPLGFLDASILCGDSLLGVFDLEILRAGIPDAAYKALSGDDKAAAKYFDRRNKAERDGQGTLDFTGGPSSLPAAPPLAASLHAVRAGVALILDITSSCCANSHPEWAKC